VSHIQIDTAYHLTLLLVGMGYCIKSMELIAISHTYLPGSPNNWEIVGVDEMQSGRLSEYFAWIYSKRGMVLLCILSMLAFLASIVFLPNDAIIKAGTFVLFLCQLLIYHRQDFGGDGSDQMSFIILFTSVLCFVLASDDAIAKVGLVFIAGQLLLSYEVSGLAKLISKEWRSGVAIQGILSTYTYGTRFTRNIFCRSLRLSQAIAWSVILLECLLPFSVLGNQTVFLTGVALGLAMHLSIAVVMGLNDFVWSFAAAYPSLFYLYLEVMGKS
jgi:hypothetical protein